MNDKLFLFSKDVCRILKIKLPPVEIAPTALPTPTSLAVYDGKRIIIRHDMFTPDVALAVAHELRHIWQVQNDKALYLKDYKELGTVDLSEYNLQLAEIDANAFALVIMSTFFNIKPLFKGLSDNAKQAIDKRAKEIVAEM